MEIGSEFWEENILNKNKDIEILNIEKDTKLLMSGSTAIDYVLQDIKDEEKVVYMPNYCCESMVRPFIDNNYKIKYYNVDLINNKYDININEECSIFFAMSYFGYSSSNMDEYIKEFNKKRITVIEDITHRLLCKNNHCIEATYLVGSLRKWFPIYTGGIAAKVQEKFNATTEKYSIDNNLVEIKKKAMLLKREYIMDKKKIDKKQFLELFNKANMLIENYKNKLMDKDSINILKNINIDEIIKIRKNNVKIIEKKLINSKINLLYKLQEDDCPLFVPIIIENREEIKKKLIQKNIYCPVHWPNFNDFDNHIYNKELSLICDQRYSENEIEKYIDELIEVIERN